MFSGRYRKSERSPKSIDLDYKNPRLIGYLRRESLNSQRDLILALSEHYDVITLCANIVENGFHPDETLIVIPDEGGKQNKVTVLEGNRRLAACKILLNPSILKGTSLYSKVSKLIASSNYKNALDTINRISVVEIDGRMEAFSYIASKHTQESIKSWSPYTQGAYYLSIKTPDGKISDIRKYLGQSFDISKIKHRILFYRIGEYILDMECWSINERAYLVSNIDALKIEAIIRLINNSDFKNRVASIGLDDLGNIYCKGLSKLAFDSLMEKLARSSHFSSDESGDFVLSTRQEDKKSVEQYISSCQNLINDTDEGSDFSDNTLFLNSSGETISYDDSAVVKNQQERKRKYKNTLLDKSSVTFPTGNLKLEALVEEASRLKTSNLEHTSALLSRAILEICLKVWIKNSGLESELKGKYKEKAYDFSCLLQFLESHAKELITDDKDAMQAIRAAAQGLLSRDKEILNLTNHNDFHVLSSSEFKEIKVKLDLFAQYFFPRIINKNS